MKVESSAHRGRAAVGLLLTLFLAGCGAGGWFGESDDPPLPGERISVLSDGRSLAADPRAADLPVALPRAIANEEWRQAGATPDHAPQHLELPESVSLAWSRSIGSGASRERRYLSPPVVAVNTVFALNADLRVVALASSNGEELWSADVNPEGERDGFGGGLAFDDGRIYAATGAAEVVVLDARNGEVIWRRSTAGPVRSAPTVADGRVFVVTVDNRIQAFTTEDGSELWSSSGIAETAGLLGSASPAYSQGVVLAPFSSGELIALKAENGRQVWAESLTSVRRVDSVSELSDVRGLPVIFRGYAFATGHSGQTAAINMLSGNRVWDQEFGGINTPWVAGDFLFLVSNENELICLLAGDGRVRWVRELARFADPEERTIPVVWAGPVLAGERLYLVNSLGRLVVVSPFTGETIEERELPGPTTLPPVVAARTLYVLSDSGTLAAYR